MNLTILFSPLASYTVAFFRHLAEDHGWRIQLVHQPPRKDAPYEPFDLSFCQEALQDEPPALKTLQQRVEAFAPDCVLMSSWNYKHYMRLARKLRKNGVYVVSTMDNQWMGTSKQRLGVLASPVFLKPCIDTFLVAGDRQAQFAARLGFPSVMYGYYAADVQRFARTSGEPVEQPHRFLFVGRLVEYKGLRALVAAYQLYRAAVQAPWPLTVAGTGPLQRLVDDDPSIDYRGFVQPQDLPKLIHDAGVLLLPSTFEPWGVVIHEATAAGLLVVCTPNCGASTYFVRDGVNGFIVPSEGQALAAAMHRTASMDETRLAEMASASRTLASLWTPPALARYFAEGVQAKMRARDRA